MSRGTNGFLVVPRSGICHNPMTNKKYRNWKCICGSGKKVKVCCGVAYFIPEKHARMFTAAIQGDHELSKKLYEEIQQDAKESLKKLSDEIKEKYPERFKELEKALDRVDNEEVADQNKEAVESQYPVEL